MYTWSTIFTFAFTALLVAYVLVQCVRAAVMMFEMARWLFTERKLDRKLAAFPPPQRYNGVLCPICWGEAHYDPQRRWYECGMHGVVAQIEDIHYASRN